MIVAAQVSCLTLPFIQSRCLCYFIKLEYPVIGKIPFAHSTRIALVNAA
jgi:hypothetical protein